MCPRRKRELSTRAADDFIWRDAGRTVVFRRGALAAAPQLLTEHGFDSFELLSTGRALGLAAELADHATRVHEVGPGAVPDTAASILPEEKAESLVALGGGRVIDSAKAIAAVSGARVAAIATTMSGAEMTAIHRLPAGSESESGGQVRPELVLADPEAMTSQPEAQLRASSMNALAHGADSLYTPFANPVSELAALRGAELIAGALDSERESRDRAALALGSILCGYAIDSARFALHHVVCQTLVRVLGLPHAETNAAILPAAMEAMRGRAPDQISALAQSLATTPDSIGVTIAELGGAPGLGELGGDRERLDEALDAIEARSELGYTPDPPERAELRRIIESAW